jgi:AcrR family transcriptional regulator
MAEQVSDQTRERIIEAAGEIFASQGFDQATVRGICQQASANIAAVNYHFGDKRGLYIEAVKRAHQWKMKQAVLPEPREGAEPEDRLADFVVTFLRRLKLGDRDTWQNRLMMREMMSAGTACAELVRESIRPQFDMLLAILRQMLPAEITDERVHLTAFSIVGQCLFYHFADPVVRKLIDEDEYATLSPETLARHVVQFSLAALSNVECESART